MAWQWIVVVAAVGFSAFYLFKRLRRQWARHDNSGCKACAPGTPENTPRRVSAE
jgi:hypothetical protein